MFDFGFSEIVLTSAIALIVLGPEKLPKVARQVGNWMGRARSMARQLTEQLEREVIAEDLLKAQAKTNTKTSAASAMQTGTPSAGISSAPVPFDTSYSHPSSYTPPPSSAAPPAAPTPATPMQTAPAPGALMQAAPEQAYSAHPSSPPHGADWHPAPPENKSSDG